MPAIGKALEASLVVLYVALLTSALFGGLVPDYRSAAADEVADRTLARAAHGVQDAVGPQATARRTSVRVDLPETIRGTNYRIRAEGGTLVLVHPDRGVGAETPLAVPTHVTRVEGAWESTSPSWVVVDGGDETVVRLVNGDPEGETTGGGRS